MSAQDAVELVLQRLSDGQVQALARICLTRSEPGARLTQSVVGASPAGHDAVDRLARTWSATPGLTGSGVALALEVGLRRRREAAARRSRAVWTGSGAAGEQRLTAAVLHDLIAGAEQRILLVSYAAFTLSGVAADLVAAIGRGCDVDVVFETEQDSAGAYSGSHSEPSAR